MKKNRYWAAICGVLLFLVLCAGCRQSPDTSAASLPVTDGTTTTDVSGASTTSAGGTSKPSTTKQGASTAKPTTSTTYKPAKTDCYRPWIDFSSMEDYRQAMLTCTTTDRVKKLLTEPPAQGTPNFTAQRYTMLTEEGYFLIPQLPAGYTVEEITFSGYGNSQFSVKMPSGKILGFSYYHYDYEKPVYPPKTWEEITESTVKNSRGLVIHKEHTVSRYTSGDVGIQDLYTWTEGGYPFSVSCHYDEGETPEHEEFVKQLTFEKVLIPNK